MSQLTTVTPADIEPQLQASWDQELHTDRVKTALFNLVVYVRQPERAARLQRLLDPLTGRFPCRVLVLFEDSSQAPDYLQTEIAVDFIGDPEHLVSSDQIHIHFAPHERDRAGFILVPHLLPDLPVYLLWTELPDRQDPLFSLLEPYLNQVVFDPPGADLMAQFSQQLLAILDHIPGGATDLQWASTEGWRQVIASAFNGSERLTHLRRLTALQITYADGLDELGRDTSLPALYIQGWLAAQMRWQYKGLQATKERMELHYDSPVGSITITLIATPRGEMAAGAIRQLEGDSLEGFHFELNTDASGNYVTMTGGSEAVCEIPTTLYLSHLTREQVLAKELFQRGTSDHYTRALRLISDYQEDK
jgi:glucose-6-phosphate dehydrogenase assembly protein OpcA